MPFVRKGAQLGVTDADERRLRQALVQNFDCRTRKAGDPSEGPWVCMWDLCAGLFRNETSPPMWQCLRGQQCVNNHAFETTAAGAPWTKHNKPGPHIDGKLRGLRAAFEDLKQEHNLQCVQPASHGGLLARGEGAQPALPPVAVVKGVSETASDKGYQKGVGRTGQYAQQVTQDQDRRAEDSASESDFSDSDLPSLQSESDEDGLEERGADIDDTDRHAAPFAQAVVPAVDAATE